MNREDSISVGNDACTTALTHAGLHQTPVLFLHAQHYCIIHSLEIPELE